MYEKIVGEYINKLTEDKIKTLAHNHNINLSSEEVKILYVYAKNYWKVFFKGDPNELIDELKGQINRDAFNKLYSLYLQNKNKL